MRRPNIFLAIGLTCLGLQGLDRCTTQSSQAMVFGGEQRETAPGNAKVKGNADNYYLLVFASQSEPPMPRLSHTFACFVKAGGGPDDHKILETITISWLPKSLNVVVGRLLPEEGINLELLPTLKWARGLDTKVSAWGPYRIKKELVDRAEKQKARLESGVVRFKAIDLKAPLKRQEHSNCIHAVSDIAGDELLATGTAYGEAASGMVVRHLQPWTINPGETHDWVSDGLGLKKHPIRFVKEKAK
jgi:hypothetical protein